jgi:hypothetical protein
MYSHQVGHSQLPVQVTLMFCLSLVVVLVVQEPMVVQVVVLGALLFSNSTC